MRTWILPLAMLWLVCLVTSAQAESIFVGGESEFQTITDAISIAEDGDVIIIRPGRYEETVETRSPGVTIRAAEGGEVLITQLGYVVRIRHERIRIEGVVVDGQYSDRDGIQVRGDAHGLHLINVEVRNVANDCIDLGSQHDVTIDGALIHHCLRSSEPQCRSSGCREDAHGISAAAVRNLTVRNTEIHTFSGDAIQVDPGRNEPGWSGLIIEGCRFWTAPLSEATGGFAAGVVTAENALDTKTSNVVIEPAEVMIRDTEASGFRGGLIDNMSAFNLKENVRVHVDRVTVSDSEIAFRIRGRTESRPRGAQVALSNTLIYEVDTGIRYEDDVQVVQLDSVTVGDRVGRLFHDVSVMGRIDARNVLVLGDERPIQLRVQSNLAVDRTCFVDVAENDYHLELGCAAIDAGQAGAEYTRDLDGTLRPQGDGWDIGAYEFCFGPCVENMNANTMADAGIPIDQGSRSAEPHMDAALFPDDLERPVVNDAALPSFIMDQSVPQTDMALVPDSSSSRRSAAGTSGCMSIEYPGVGALLVLCLVLLSHLFRRRAFALSKHRQL